MPRTASFYVDAALDAFNQGFTSKSAKQSALRDLGRAYEMLRDALHKAVCASAPELSDPANPSEAEWAARGDFFRANEVPFELHQVRDRHLVLFGTWTGNGDELRRLIELRATIKDAEVVPPVKAEKSERLVRVEATLRDLMETRRAQYLEAVELGELFGRLPVTANTHWVINEHGTRFLRTYFYLRGKLTPLNVIVAAAEELERRKEGE